MSRRVLIVPDKFKGTLTARAAAEAMAWGWASVHPADALDLLPMTDGGDGFGLLLSELLGAVTRSVATVDAAHRPRSAEWGWSASTQTAIIESTQSIGLALLPSGQFHPRQLDTRGLGETIASALDQGARKLIIGLGGSATNDGGFGMARALGGRFFDAAGGEIEIWPDLTRLARWTMPTSRFEAVEIVAGCDVENPLLGPQGCSAVYGPQKGLKPADFPAAEAALARLAEVTRQQLGRDVALEPGSGAAGGLGFALRAFLGGRLESGFGIFAALAGLPARIAAADLVLTGEGGLDRQTLMGKGTGRVAVLAKAAGKPCVGLAGMVEAVPELELAANAAQRLFAGTYALVPEVTTLDEAKAEAGRHLEELARRVARKY
jgi:glycerate kinase